MRSLLSTGASVLVLGLASPAATQDEPRFTADIAPILQARCAGCHRPDKAKGGLDLSDLDTFARGGASGPAFRAGDPDGSLVVGLITGSGGKAPEMPADGAPLTAAQVDLVRRWIAAGAPRGTAAPGTPGAPGAPGARRTRALRAYPAAPPVAALAFSPDGALLAAGGYHEVLLHGVAGGITARLVGRSPKIQSLAFSTDGRWLAVAAGAPGRRGEIQIWDVASRRLHRSFDVGHDTLFGISFAPDGTRVAVGCADRTVRVVNIADGAELLQFKNHSEWVLGTAFTVAGDRLVSGSRDKALKIIELASARFVDDINSPIDPILGLVRHPTRDIVLYAGALGTPRIYKISDNQARTSARRDNNLLRALETQSGPVHAVAFSADGKLAAAAGTDPIARVHDAGSGEVVARLRGHAGPVFAVAFHPDGRRVATAGYDGIIRVYDAGTGRCERELPAVPLATGDTAGADAPVIASIAVSPAALELRDGRDERRVLVTGVTADGRSVDLTPAAALEATTPHVAIGTDGYILPRRAGKTVVRVHAGGLTAALPVGVAAATRPPVHFTRDVMPVLARAGCNAGTCHGAQAGKNGFMLSLRGFDPAGDYRALVEDLSGRRFDRIHPEESLMLLKPTAAVAHEGQQVFTVGSRHYGILRRWIAEGTRYRDDDAGQVTRLTVLPERIDLALPGERQSVLITARYADGTAADVTRDAILSVSDIEVAAIDGTVVTGKRRGESSVLVRYEGRYAVAPVTVMGDRSGFAWQARPQHNFIDQHVDAKLARIRVQAAELCTDAEFVRRLYLDLTGAPPAPEVARAFVADRTEQRAKRDALIDALIGSADYVEHWANKWADLLQCNSQTLGAKGVWVFRRWLSRAVAENTPYDEFVRELVNGSGSTYANPEANYMRALSDRGRTPDPTKMTEDVTQTFLGVRFGCCKCHNHPFEKWTQDQYYELTAHFARVRYKKGPADGEIIVYDGYDGGETVHPRTAAAVPPQVPFSADCAGDAPTRRERLAAWLTSKDNRLFARSYVNRVWSYFFGIGIIEPVDDIRAGNPPSNPELLDALEREFIASGFDGNALVRTICRSHTWQRSFRASRWNAGDRRNFARALPRRLSAEQLLDAVALASGVPVAIAGLPAGSRSVEAPDGIVAGNDFLQLFGRPKRESACECARSSDLSLAHALNLVGGKTLHDSIVADGGRVARLIAGGAGDRAVVTELYWATLCRPPTPAELRAFADLGTGPSRTAAAQDLLWALTNSPAFLFNR